MEKTVRINISLFVIVASAVIGSVGGMLILLCTLDHSEHFITESFVIIFDTGGYVVFYRNHDVIGYLSPKVIEPSVGIASLMLVLSVRSFRRAKRIQRGFTVVPPAGSEPRG